MSAEKRHLLVVLLAVNSGFTDALGYGALGGAFSSVMTGNMVIFGWSVGSTSGSLALHAGAAVLAFIVGCVLGVRIAGNTRTGDPVWPVQVTVALAAQALVTLAYACWWWGVDGHPGAEVTLFLLMFNAVSLGMQSSTVQRFGVSGLSTTYLTGTLTTTVRSLASGQRTKDVANNALLLLALVAGAALGGVLVPHTRLLLPVVQLALLATVIACARPRRLAETTVATSVQSVA